MIVRAVPQRREIRLRELEVSRELLQQLPHAVQVQQQYRRCLGRGRVLCGHVFWVARTGEAESENISILVFMRA